MYEKRKETESTKTRKATKVFTGISKNPAHATPRHSGVVGGREPDGGSRPVQHPTIPHPPDARRGTTAIARGDERIGEDRKLKQKTTWTREVMKCCCRRPT